MISPIDLWFSGRLSTLFKNRLMLGIGSHHVFQSDETGTARRVSAIPRKPPDEMTTARIFPTFMSITRFSTSPVGCDTSISISSADVAAWSNFTTDRFGFRGAALLSLSNENLAEILGDLHGVKPCFLKFNQRFQPVGSHPIAIARGLL